MLKNCINTFRQPIYNTIEMCVRMGFLVGIGIRWDSDWNGNEKQLSMEMGTGTISVDVKMLENAL